MAELIPLEYRLRAAVRRRLQNWCLWTVLLLAACGTGVGLVWAWQIQSTLELEALRAQHREKAALIVRSGQLIAARENLATRMAKIQQLSNDQTIITLMNTVAAGFSQQDCLEFLHINNREPDPNLPPAPLVRVSGITHNSSSLAELMTRLGQSARPELHIQLRGSKRESYLDGQVMRFQITCDRPSPRG